MYRKKLVKNLCENPNNNPQDLSDEFIASFEYETLNIDNTVVINLSPCLYSSQFPNWIPPLPGTPLLDNSNLGTSVPDIDELLSTNMKKIKLQKEIQEQPVTTPLTSSPPCTAQPKKKRVRSANVSGTARQAKRQKSGSQYSKPQQRCLKSKFATMLEHRT
jgi:hypothetical protein